MRLEWDEWKNRVKKSNWKKLRREYSPAVYMLNEELVCWFQVVYVRWEAVRISRYKHIWQHHCLVLKKCNNWGHLASLLRKCKWYWLVWRSLYQGQHQHHSWHTGVGKWSCVRYDYATVDLFYYYLLLLYFNIISVILVTQFIKTLKDPINYLDMLHIIFFIRTRCKLKIK